ncbi:MULTISPECIES: hypothetical protein [Pseudoalteromonas]|uniref:Bacterial mobilisation domain-containing protein n=1 Tax=Pseudoalteromonas amylolytica TaxID=1859457 RepID=A0A1S1N1Q5_9GAMM|nr:MULTISPECIES: hypothetical protein [Pseudoalteromonas]OHU89215.1 hypothetical protein BFC16_06145 [Pseudoalteromonas sp. JW3]OHU92115.1 hypothetical protein BET10_07250 [Pseudoalteromonas amylolytica]
MNPFLNTPTLRKDFTDCANDNPKKSKPSRPSPFCLRLTPEERCYLEQKAGSQSLGSYIRAQILEDRAQKRRKLRKPKSDEKALASLLQALGRSHIPSNLNQLAKAVNAGTLPLTGDLEQELQTACAAVIAMRSMLIEALGLHEEKHK